MSPFLFVIFCLLYYKVTAEILVDHFISFATIINLLSVYDFKIFWGVRGRERCQRYGKPIEKEIKHAINSNNLFCQTHDAAEFSPTMILHLELTLHSMDVL